MILFLIALPVAFVAGIVGTAKNQESVEQALANRIAPAADDLPESLSIDYDHLTTRVTGIVRTKSEKSEYISEVALAASAGRIDDQVEVRPPGKVIVSREGKKATLAGDVATAAEVTSLDEMGDALPGIESVENQLAIAPVFPLEHGSLFTAAANGLLPHASPSSVSLIDSTLTLTGELPDPQRREQIVAAIGNVPEGVTVNYEGLTVAPPAEPHFTLVGPSSTGSATVLGLLPSDTAKARFLDAARAGLPEGARLVDQLKVNSHVRKRPWISSLPEVITSLLADFESAELEVTADRVRLIGESSDSELVSRVSDMFAASVGPDPTPEIALKWVKPPEPEPKLPLISATDPAQETEIQDAVRDTESAALTSPSSLAETSTSETVAAATMKPNSPEPDDPTISSAAAQASQPKPTEMTDAEEITADQSDIGPITIFFETNSTTIDPSETAALKQAVDSARSRDLTGAPITLRGFADYRGSYSENRRLTVARLEAVRDALIEAGIDPESVSSLEPMSDLESERTEFDSEKSDAELRQSRRVEIHFP
ncbi:MAG: OmpA family protein [Verrucomicrobiota bacterium]